MSEEQIVHLLKPKEFRTYCIPSRAPGPAMNVTQFPSKASCVTCLTKFRYAKGHKAIFRKRWTARHDPKDQEPKLDD